MQNLVHISLGDVPSKMKAKSRKANILTNQGKSVGKSLFLIRGIKKNQGRTANTAGKGEYIC